jgi:hypothetical protein
MSRLECANKCHLGLNCVSCQTAIAELEASGADRFDRVNENLIGRRKSNPLGWIAKICKGNYIPNFDSGPAEPGSSLLGYGLE